MIKMKYTDYTNNKKYIFDIEDFSDKAFIKMDDGTTAFNVYMIGQNIVNDLWSDKYFINNISENNKCLITDEEIIDWILYKFSNIFYEINKEIKYQLKNNPDINNEIQILLEKDLN